ncbi:MAG: hypothetical protein GY765_25215, partial [bacterium]|nr:hypothetical protein [bacterium]
KKYPIEEFKNTLHETLGKSTQALRDIQAVALIDIFSCKGGFLPIGVGHGKTLISLLCPVVLDARRPILFIPPDLRTKTKEIDVPEASKNWRLHPDLKIIGYSELSLAKNSNMLFELKPDLLIFDECHRLKNPKSARTRRVIRYLKEYPETICVAMSGTISTRSLRDYAHILLWCLKASSPLPSTYYELGDWADALDEYAEERSIGPGALMRFTAEGENARQGYRRRLHSTPGVVATSHTEIGTSLVLRDYKGVYQTKIIYEAMQDMLATWETPSGDLISEAVALWRHCRELSLGFFFRWDPPGPKEWMDARRAWKSFVREKIKYSMHSNTPLDSELQVWNWCTKQGGITEQITWKAIKDTFKPNPVPVWLDDMILKIAGAWLEANEECIAWVENPVFGEALSEMSGFPYFGAGDNGILRTKETKIIASMAAHGEGKNLQRFNKSLIVSPPSNGKAWEQVLGRTHRFGQEADEVTVDIFLHTDAMKTAFEKAKGESRYIEDTTGNRQKLNYADFIGR